jgi:hypothetical protein
LFIAFKFCVEDHDSSRVLVINVSEGVPYLLLKGQREEHKRFHKGLAFREYFFEPVFLNLTDLSEI